MSSFLMSVDLHGKTVILVGNGPQISAKEEKLRHFGPIMVKQAALTADDLQKKPALVVVGDMPAEEAIFLAALCREYRVPVNVVDRPELCSFMFPALICRGDLTVAVATGGRGPGFAASLSRKIDAILPDRTEEILAWLSENRFKFRERGILKQAVEESLHHGRPLTEEELSQL